MLEGWLISLAENSRLRWTIFGFAAALVVFAVLMSRAIANYPQTVCLPGSFTQPVLALELARSGAELEQAVASQAEALRRHTRLDFGFIAAYAGLFVGFILLLRVRDLTSRWKGLLLLAALLVVGAALADGLENLAILTALKANAFTDAMAEAIRRPSMAKWGLLEAALLLSGLAMLRNLQRMPLGVTGTLLVGAALTYGGAVGLLFVIFPVAIETSLKVVVASSVPTALLLPFVKR